jgi:hypothetical protein
MLSMVRRGGGGEPKAVMPGASFRALHDNKERKSWMKRSITCLALAATFIVSMEAPILAATTAAAQETEDQARERRIRERREAIERQNQQNNRSTNRPRTTPRPSSCSSNCASRPI